MKLTAWNRWLIDSAVFFPPVNCSEADGPSQPNLIKCALSRPVWACWRFHLQTRQERMLSSMPNVPMVGGDRSLGMTSLRVRPASLF